MTNINKIKSKLSVAIFILACTWIMTLGTQNESQLLDEKSKLKECIRFNLEAAKSITMDTGEIDRVVALAKKAAEIGPPESFITNSKDHKVVQNFFSNIRGLIMQMMNFNQDITNDLLQGMMRLLPHGEIMEIFRAGKFHAAYGKLSSKAAVRILGPIINALPEGRLPDPFSGDFESLRSLCRHWPSLLRTVYNGGDLAEFKATDDTARNVAALLEKLQPSALQELMRGSGQEVTQRMLTIVETVIDTGDISGFGLLIDVMAFSENKDNHIILGRLLADKLKAATKGTDTMKIYRILSLMERVMSYIDSRIPVSFSQSFDDTSAKKVRDVLPPGPALENFETVIRTARLSDGIEKIKLQPLKTHLRAFAALFKTILPGKYMLSADVFNIARTFCSGNSIEQLGYEQLIDLGTVCLVAYFISNQIKIYPNAKAKRTQLESMLSNPRFWEPLLEDREAPILVAFFDLPQATRDHLSGTSNFARIATRLEQVAQESLTKHADRHGEELVKLEESMSRSPKIERAKPKATSVNGRRNKGKSASGSKWADGASSEGSPESDCTDLSPSSYGGRFAPLADSPDSADTPPAEGISVPKSRQDEISYIHDSSIEQWGKIARIAWEEASPVAKKEPAPNRFAGKSASNSSSNHTSTARVEAAKGKDASYSSSGSSQYYFISTPGDRSPISGATPVDSPRGNDTNSCQPKIAWPEKAQDNTSPVLAALDEVVRKAGMGDDSPIVLGELFEDNSSRPVAHDQSSIVQGLLDLIKSLDAESAESLKARLGEDGYTQLQNAVKKVLENNRSIALRLLEKHLLRALLELVGLLEEYVPFSGF